MEVSVTLGKHTTRVGNKTYTYWVIRWFSTDGSRHSEHLGRVDEISARQAEKRRRAKRSENPLNIKLLGIVNLMKIADGRLPLEAV